VESSLDKLNTDYLDIVLIHSNGDDEQIIKTQSVFETLMQLKQAGKIRLYGMSTKTITGGLLAAEMSDIVMITYNTQHLVEEKVIHYAHQTQKGVFIKKALISGHLSLTPKEHIDFVLKQRGVTSAIVGTINPDHLCELC
jgi:aryl-alcohol dehydrogenase-like predicted oxidoreductase